MTQASCPTTPTHRPVASPLWTAVVFALLPLIVGMIPGGLVFGLNPNVATTIGLDAVPIPAWVFIAVWIVTYPSMGIAAWLVWRKRTEVDACVPVAILIAGFAITLSFWLTNSLQMTATLDAINLVLAWTTVWVFSRYSQKAALWLLPWAIWMPITLVVKLVALSRGLN